MLFNKQSLDRYRTAVANNRIGPVRSSALAPLESFQGYEFAGEAPKRVRAP